MSDDARTETITSGKELLHYYLSKDIPTYVSGPPGVGKSSMYRQVADEMAIKLKTKVGFRDLRLSMMDPVDLLGLQSVANGVTQWNRPAWMPIEGKDPEVGVVLLDELTDVGRAMQSAAYQLILDRRAGPHKLLPGWIPCAAGNRKQDKAAAQALSTALANRFGHFEVAANKDCFIDWCNANEIDPLIPGFIRFRPALLYSMEGADLRAFPTPRSWAQASKCVQAAKELRFRLMAGLVGDGPAGEFETYMQGLDLPTLDEILANPKKVAIPEKPSSKYALSSMLARYAKRDTFGKILEYVGREKFGKDFETVTALDATKRDTTLCDTKAWINWANRNNNYHI